MSSSAIEKKQKKTPWYQEIDGLRVPGFYSVEVFRSALAYKPRHGDVFTVSYPKCGTTWIQNIVTYIFREGKPFSSSLEFFTHIPFVEMTCAKPGEILKRPEAKKIHLPFHRTPWSPEAKYIYVARNPKDCCVSFYYFLESTPAFRFEDGEFDDFFELFMNGQVGGIDYFDHTLSWYEHRNEPNVLFITYEQVKKDTKTSVLKIAEFLGTHYKDKLEKNEKMLQDVIHHSSFESMKEHTNRFIKEMSMTPREKVEQNLDIPQELRSAVLSGYFKVMKERAEGVSFIRKGVVGDWKNCLSPENNSRLEKRIREKFAGTDLLAMWKDDMCM